MGTNFYLVKSLTEGIDSGIHIGKRSAGWPFHFQVNKKAHNLEEMKEFTKEGLIFDEYEKLWFYEQFWNEVDRLKLKQNKLSSNLVSKMFCGDYEESGYIWSTLDFR